MARRVVADLLEVPARKGTVLVTIAVKTQGNGSVAPASSCIIGSLRSSFSKGGSPYRTAVAKTARPQSQGGTESPMKCTHVRDGFSVWVSEFRVWGVRNVVQVGAEVG